MGDAGGCARVSFGDVSCLFGRGGGGSGTGLSAAHVQSWVLECDAMRCDARCEGVVERRDPEAWAQVRPEIECAVGEKGGAAVFWNGGGGYNGDPWYGTRKVGRRQAVVGSVGSLLPVGMFDVVRLGSRSARRRRIQSR
jgi:hypothetical protein